MREKIQKLIDEGNAVTSTGLPYNMWLNHFVINLEFIKK